MVGWCQSASRVAKALEGIAQVKLLILTNQTAAIQSLCPGADTIDPDHKIAELAAKWTTKFGKVFDPPVSNIGENFHHANLQKLQLLGLGGGYDAVLFTDGDIMMLGADDGERKVAAMRKTWARRLPAFLADANAELLGNADWDVPTQGGLWMIKPTQQSYDDAVSILSRQSWNVTHGFDLVGPPLRP